MALAVLALVALAAAGCLCVRRRRRSRQSLVRESLLDGGEDPGLPAFRGPLRRIVDDSRHKGRGPGVTAPLEAAYANPFADQHHHQHRSNDLQFSSHGQDLGVVRATRPAQVARGFRDQMTGAPVSAVVQGWSPAPHR